MFWGVAFSTRFQGEEGMYRRFILIVRITCRLMNFSASTDLMFGFQVFLPSLFSAKLHDGVGKGLVGKD